MLVEMLASATLNVGNRPTWTKSVTLTHPHAVDEVAGRAAKLHAERDADQPALHRRVDVVQHDRREPEEARHDEERRLPPAGFRNAAPLFTTWMIFHEREAVIPLAQQQVRAHERLRELLFALITAAAM